MASCSAGMKAIKVKDGLCHLIDNFDAYITNQHSLSEYGKYGSFQVYKKKKKKSKLWLFFDSWELQNF